MINHLQAWTYFLKLGLTGFGGPLAMISQMQKDLVEKKAWMDREEFLRTLPWLKSMPGPVAFQCVLFLACKKLPKWSALVCGVLFVMPAFLMMWGIAWFGGRKFLESYSGLLPFFWGFQAVALGLLFWALKDLTQVHWGNHRFWAYAVGSLIAIGLIGIPEPLVLLGAGGLAVFGGRLRERSLMSFPWELMWLCLQAGGLSFGTGLAIVPLLQNDFVNRLHWVSQGDFLDAVALGQLTPGPVIIAVTYLGFKVAGTLGAFVASVAVFLPSAIHQLSWFPKWASAIGKKTWISDFVIGSYAALAAGIVIALAGLSRNLNSVQFLILVGFLLLKFFFRSVPQGVFILGGGMIAWIVF